MGLVETSIGKMVPIMTSHDLDEDHLQVFAEPYNTLILDKKGFRGEIPDIKELALKENMKAWVDRKAFIHNLGHATAAYFGHLKYPDAIFMYEVLADSEVYLFTKKVMHESGQVLMATYPTEFTLKVFPHTSMICWNVSRTEIWEIRSSGWEAICIANLGPMTGLWASSVWPCILINHTAQSLRQWPWDSCSTAGMNTGHYLSETTSFMKHAWTTWIE